MSTKKPRRRRSRKNAFRRFGAALQRFFADFSFFVDYNLAWLFAPLKFVLEWLFSRRYKELLFGAPFLFASVLLTVGVVASRSRNVPVTVDSDLIKAVAAERAGEDELSSFHLKRAQMASYGSNEAKFSLARILLSRELSQEALSIMRKLAPEDEAGFVPAHLWMAQQLESQIVPVSSKDSAVADDEEESKQKAAKQSDLLDRIKKHYELILIREPKHQAANERMAVISLNNGDVPAAIGNLKIAVNQNPGLRALLTKLLFSQGEESQGKVEAERSVQYLEEAIEKDGLSEDELVNNQLNLAGCYMLLKDYQKAAESLTSNPDELPEEERRRNALGEVAFQWAMSIDGENAASSRQKLSLLDLACRCRPTDPRVLIYIAGMAELEGDTGSAAQTLLKDTLASGAAPAIVHVTLGNMALRREEYEVAMRHFELANQVNPETPLILNNLGVLLSRQENPDFSRALQLIERAIELSPEVMEFYDSRGEIYLRMGRYTDAIGDLERAARAMPGRPAIHDRLSQAYAATGDEELAEMHRLRKEFFQKEKLKESASE